MAKAENDPSKGRGHSRVKGQWSDGSPVVPVGGVVKRVDRYTVQVDDVRVRATTDQEARIAAMSDEQRARFVKIMGGGCSDARA